ncbi:hypothetical protein BOX15_Mlig012800g1, partial [Macrostomum lignano]
VPVSLAGIQQRLSTAIGTAFSGLYTVRCERPPDQADWLDSYAVPASSGQLLRLIEQLAADCDKRMSDDAEPDGPSADMGKADPTGSASGCWPRCLWPLPTLCTRSRLPTKPTEFAAAASRPCSSWPGRRRFERRPEIRSRQAAGAGPPAAAAPGRWWPPPRPTQPGRCRPAEQPGCAHLPVALPVPARLPASSGLHRPVCAASEACLVRLFYTARLVQVFLDLPDCDEGEGDESDGADGDTPLDQLVTSYRFAAGLWSSPAASGAQLAADVRAAAAPFLRSAVRLYACLSGRDGAASPESGITDEEAEFRRLAELLRLPADPCHLFAASPAAADLASHWCLDPRLEGRRKRPAGIPSRSLAPLPDDYAELLRLLDSPLSRRCCPDADSSAGRAASAISGPARPALCLICGRLVCAACCRVRLPDGRPVGAAGAHARLCSGAGAGVFLRLAGADLLLVAPTFGAACIAAAPYADKFSGGEAAGPGQPMRLDGAALRRLRADWLGHRLLAEAIRRRCADLDEP